MNTIKIWGVAYRGQQIGDHRLTIGTVWLPSTNDLLILKTIRRHSAGCRPMVTRLQTYCQIPKIVGRSKNNNWLVIIFPQSADLKNQLKSHTK